MKHRKKVKKQKWTVMAVLLIFVSGWSSIGEARKGSCNSLLDECAIVVEKQEVTIKKQGATIERQKEVVKTQEELLQTAETRVEEVQHESKNMRGIAIGELALIILMLL